MQTCILWTFLNWKTGTRIKKRGGGDVIRSQLLRTLNAMHTMHFSIEAATIIIIIIIIILIARSYTAHYHCNSCHALRPLLLLSSGNHQNYFACTTYRILNCGISHNSYPYIAWVDEASEIKYLAQGHKHVGANGARTHNLPFMSPARPYMTCLPLGLYI